MRVLAIVCLGLFGVVALAESDEATVVATDFYESLSSNNFGHAKTLLVNPENLDDDGSTSFDIEEHNLSGASVEGSTATVKTETTNSKGTLSFDTILENKAGDWKMSFNKTMLNMMRAATQERQVEGDVEMSIDSQ